MSNATPAQRFELAVSAVCGPYAARADRALEQNDPETAARYIEEAYAAFDRAWEQCRKRPRPSHVVLENAQSVAA